MSKVTDHISLFLSVAFLFSTIATLRVNPVLKSKLVKQLDKKEKEYYKKIILMRRNIYLQGLIFGIIASVIFMLYTKITDKTVILFSAISITFFINYFYYILYPKNKFLLTELDTRSEKEAWLDIYKSMQFRYHFAFLLGLVFVYFGQHYYLFNYKKN